MLEQPGFYEDLNRRTAELTGGAAGGARPAPSLPAIAAGRNSFWQLLFMAEEPVNQVDIMTSDIERMKRLDLALLRGRVYVLPGVRRFVSAVNDDADVAWTVEAMEAACKEVA